MSNPSFVFLDPQGRRWPLFRRFALVVAFAFGVAFVLFLAAVWIRPAVRLPAAVRELKGRLKAGRVVALPDPKAQNWQQYVAQSRAAQERLAALRAKLGPPLAGPTIRLGF